MKDHYYAVIMAGGGGTRLWPLSTREHPKQMLKIAGERTMFQRTVDRLAGLISPSHILVVSTAEQAEQLQAQSEQIPVENYLIEPMPKGTASVVGFAASWLQHIDPDAVMVVLPADHFIENTALFQTLLTNAYHTAQENHLVTMGIHPLFPSTGMGYLEQGKRIEKSFHLFEVEKFHEKPNKETAEAYLKTGKFWWNSGMFIWRCNRILEEISLWLPDLSEKLDIINGVFGKKDFDSVMPEVWKTIEPATVDYGILEKAADVVFLPAENLQWNDIGSWESIFDVIPADENRNISMNCQMLAVDSEGSLACSDSLGKLIVLVGMKDMVVVETDQAVMVCPRAETQRVREIVELLKKKNMNSYL